MDEYFSDSRLVNSPPIKRAAYSDRTAWIMAEIARLVYEPLPPEVTVKSYMKEIEDAIRKGEYHDVVEAVIHKAMEGGVKSTSVVEETLREANFELLESFTQSGTEALLCRLSHADKSPGMVVLAFRGTQPSIQDVLSDIKADLVPAPGAGRAHRGFLEAYDNVKVQIKGALEKHRGEVPLYITGHSLGGALAMVATRYLGNDSTGATYTFGCPRVADNVFFESIKTPVYRIVNAADGVPRVPFGYGLSVFLSLIRLIPINGTRRISEFICRMFVGYTHYGNLVFLSAAANVPDSAGIGFKNLKVTKSPNIFKVTSVVFPRLIGTRFKAAASDHRMAEYSQKLLAYAQRRNKA